MEVCVYVLDLLSHLFSYILFFDHFSPFFAISFVSSGKTLVCATGCIHQTEAAN